MSCDHARLRTVTKTHTGYTARGAARPGAGRGWAGALSSLLSALRPLSVVTRLVVWVLCGHAHAISYNATVLKQLMTQPKQNKTVNTFMHMDIRTGTLCRYRQESTRTHHTCAVSREITSLRTAPRRELAQTDRCARRRVRRLPSRDGREQGGDAGMRGLPNIRRVRRAAARRRD